jgi:hypothetical protein
VLNPDIEGYSALHALYFFLLNPDRLHTPGLSLLLAARCKKFAAKFLQQTVNLARSPPIGIKQTLQSSLIPDDP